MGEILKRWGEIVYGRGAKVVFSFWGPRSSPAAGETRDAKVNPWRGSCVRLINKSFIIAINSARVGRIFSGFSGLNNTQKIRYGGGWKRSRMCVWMGQHRCGLRFPQPVSYPALLVYTLRYGLEAPSWFNGRLNGWTSFRFILKASLSRTPWLLISPIMDDYFVLPATLTRISYASQWSMSKKKL